MTRTGIMLGWPAHLAPGAAPGGAVTPAADLWGRGATLFGAVEGAPPHDAGGDPLETVGKVVNGKVPKPKAGPLAEVNIALVRKDPLKRISLLDVRHLLFPLQTRTPLDLFGPELFKTPDGKKTAAQLDATDTQVIKTVAPESLAPPEKKAESSSSELATDPGPLPFLRPPATPAPPPPMPVPLPGSPPRAPRARRSPAATARLAGISILLFLAAAGGGFVLARTVGGRPLLPPAAADQTTPSVMPDQGPPELVQQQGDASPVNGGKSGTFGLQVPKGWQRFVAPHRLAKFGDSRGVQFVSPDGWQAIRVELLPNFLLKHDTNEYLSTLYGRYPPDAVNHTEPVPLEDKKGVEVVYRAAERGALPASQETSMTQATFAQLIESNDDLWVLSLTVPVGQDSTAQQDVFEPVAKTFKIEG